jgi:hypothetical protein
MSNKGVVLRADVSGKIVMKTYLSGMPGKKELELIYIFLIYYIVVSNIYLFIYLFYSLI